MRFKLYAIITILITSSLLSAQTNTAVSAKTIENLKEDMPWLSSDVLDDLIENGEHTSFYSAQMPRPLVAHLPGLSDMHDRLASVNPTIGVEALFIVENYNNTSDDQLMQVLSQISSMKGIEYFSSSRGQMHVLFEESHVVPNVGNQAKKHDPSFRGAPLSMTIYQQDASFGGNYYSLDYEKTATGYRMSMQNLNQMYYAIVPVVGEKSLVIELYIEKHDDYIILYGNSAVNAFTPFGMEDAIQSSFYNRIKAIFSWFAAKI